MEFRKQCGPFYFEILKVHFVAYKEMHLVGVDLWYEGEVNKDGIPHGRGIGLLDSKTIIMEGTFENG